MSTRLAWVGVWVAAAAGVALMVSPAWLPLFGVDTTTTTRTTIVIHVPDSAMEGATP